MAVSAETHHTTLHPGTRGVLMTSSIPALPCPHPTHFPPPPVFQACARAQPTLPSTAGLMNDIRRGIFDFCPLYPCLVNSIRLPPMIQWPDGPHISLLGLSAPITRVFVYRSHQHGGGERLHSLLSRLDKEYTEFSAACPVWRYIPYLSFHRNAYSVMLGRMNIVHMGHIAYFKEVKLKKMIYNTKLISTHTCTSMSI